MCINVKVKIQSSKLFAAETRLSKLSFLSSLSISATYGKLVMMIQIRQYYLSAPARDDVIDHTYKGLFRLKCLLCHKWEITRWRHKKTPICTIDWLWQTNAYTWSHRRHSQTWCKLTQFHFNAPNILHPSCPACFCSHLHDMQSLLSVKV